MAVVALVALVVTGLAAEGGYAASVVNAGDSARTGDVLLSAAAGSTAECNLGTATYSPITSNTAPCSGTVEPSGTLPAAGTTATQTTTVADPGSVTPTGMTMTDGVCGATQLLDTKATADPMLVRGVGFNYAQTGPLTGGTALGLTGSSGYASDISDAAGPATTTFTEAIWFRTVASTTTGGTLMGFTDTMYNKSTAWDKILWVDNAGHVVWNVDPSSSVELTSTGAYNDGKWHLAVAELNTASGMSLSVDGGTPVTNTTKSAQASTGYWHVGWDNEASGRSDPPSTPYMNGALADAVVFVGTALTTAQITALDTAGTQAAFASDVAADGDTYFWPLGDNPATPAADPPYTGAIPGVTPAVCAFVDATVQAATTITSCVKPAQTGTCPAPAATTTLAAVAGTNRTVTTAPAAGGGQALTVTLTCERDTTTTVAASPNVTGLNLTSAVTLVGAAGSAGQFTASLSWPSEAVVL